MSRHRPVHRPLLLALPLLLGAAVFEPLADYSHDPAAPPLASEISFQAGSFQPPGALGAQRQGGCDAADLELRGSATDEELVVSGLHAHSCGRFPLSVESHLRTVEYSGPLCDWRHWSLGESAEAIGQLELAQSSFADLAADHPESPLAPLSAVRAVELALRHDQPQAATDLVQRARQLAVDLDLAARLETAAWRLAADSGVQEELEATARRLLVGHPLTAAELQVADVFRDADGTLDWPSFLADDELMGRAQSLVAAELFPSAVETLEQVTPAARNLDWRLLRARALTLARDGKKAHESLSEIEANAPQLETRLEWLRAKAALEAAVARRGRRSSAAERRDMRQLAHRHLERVIELGTDRDLVGQALRLLFEDRADSAPFEESLATLRTLKRLIPTDETGVRFLWFRGWKELERGNNTTAIGYWAELLDLYPTTSRGRAALYWSAKAHRALGHRERSQQLLQEVVSAPFDDFYHRHAMQWLEEPPDERRRPPVRRRLWPTDPLLERARWLNDIGLHETAAFELALLSDRAERRAVRALHAEILAGQGETRRSIIELRRAFPELGTQLQHRAPKRAQHLYYPLEYRDIVTAQAADQDLSPHLVFGMIRQESAFDPEAHSWAGARGLMQVMPATGREWARRLGLSYSRARLADPTFSVRLGTAYYRRVLLSFGDQELALAGYNAGPSRIRRLWARTGDWDELDRFVENLPFEETKTYVKRVVLYAASYQDLYAEEG